MKTRLTGRVFVVGCWLLVVGCRAPEAHVSRQPATDNRQPHRVITLAPNLTEIVFALGAGDRIVATDDFSDSPPAAKRLPKVGGVEPNVERIVAARPDVVLASASANVTPLRKAGVPLDVIRTDRVAEIAPAMEHIGRELGAPKTNEAMHALSDSIAKQRRTRTRPPRILFVAWTQPLYVGGHDTFIDDVYAICGARNAVDVKAWPQYAIESVVAAPPDIILHSSRLDLQPLLVAAPELAMTSRIVAIDENRFTRPGPNVADAARDLNAIIDEWEKSH